MSTALIVPSSKFVALDQGNQKMQQYKQNLAASGESIGPQDLIRVKTPTGGGTKWEISDGLGSSESTDAITGVLVLYQPCGILWPAEELSEGQMPVLRTFDLMTAEQVGPIPDDMLEVLNRFKIGERTFNWKDLPYNQWGSGKGGTGKRCKEQRMMFLLRESDPFPLLLTVQPGSLKNITGFIKKLAGECPYWQAVVELKLQKERSSNGQPFSQIVPRLVGKLSDEDAARVKVEYTDTLQRLLTRIEVDHTEE